MAFQKNWGAGGIAADYTGRSLCDVGCRPETAVFDNLLVDNLDCRGSLTCCKTKPRADFGYDVCIERSLDCPSSVGWSWSHHGRLRTRLTRNAHGSQASLRSRSSSAHRLALRRRHDDRPQIVRFIAGLRHSLRHTRIHRSRGEEGQETKRNEGYLQVSLEREFTALIVQYVLPTARKMTGNKIRHCTARRRNNTPVSAVAVAFCPRPRRQMRQLLVRHRSTPPDAFARDHDRQQVSWLAGYRFGPTFPETLSIPSGIIWSSAIRLQLRGQPRTYVLAHTHRIPLVSPFGHYRSQTWHRIV
jgi:hypothetical protein